MEDLFIYIDYVEPKLLCPLCSNPFQNPITLGCKHTFCSECVFGWVSVTSPPISPPPQFDTRSILSKQSKVSRKEPNSGSRLNNKQKEPKAISLDQALNNTYSNNNNSTRSSHSRNNSLLPDLDLFCPLCKSSSKEYYSTETINQELEELRVKCLTCEEILPKKNFNFHLENECLERFVQCPHHKCTQQVSRKNMRRHAEMCHYQYTMSDRSSIVSSTIHTADISQSDENGIDLKECEPGVVFEYYRGEFDQLPNFDQLVPNSVGVLQNISIGPLTEKADFLEPNGEVSDLELGNFAIKYTFYLSMPKSGSHLFYLESNDGSELFVENMQKPIISNDGVHYSKEKEGKVSLNKGKHKVVVTYFHKNGKLRESSTLGPFLSFKYYSSDPYWPIKSNFNKELIPDNMLFYHPSDLLAEYKSQADRMVSVSKNALSMRQLQLQLEVANSTISSLEQMVHALTITTEEKLVNMGKALEGEQNKRLELVERISQLRLFSPPTQQTNGGSDGAPPEQVLEEEFLGQFDVQRHVDEVDNLKKLYFHALALCIKMNMKSKSPGSEDPNLPEVSLQTLYEQCVIYNELPVDCWPGFISRNLTAHPKQKQSKFSIF